MDCRSTEDLGVLVRDLRKLANRSLNDDTESERNTRVSPVAREEEVEEVEGEGSMDSERRCWGGMSVTDVDDPCGEAGSDMPR